MAVAVAYGLSRPHRYSASSSVLVSPPTNATGVDAARYVADQVAILTSPKVAGAAADAMNAQLGGVKKTSQDVQNATSVSSTGDSDLITIQFRADNASVARAGSDAVANAYASQASSAIQAKLDRLGAAVSSLDMQLSDIGARLQTALGRRVISQDAAVSALRDEQKAALSARSQLVAQREQTLAQQLIDAGTTVFPAGNPSDSSTSSFVRLVLVALLLGLLVGSAAAYITALRRRRFDRDTEPMAVLNAPLLAVLPRGPHTHDDVSLPVAAHPGGAAAQPYGFAASALASRAELCSIYIIVSARSGDGRTTFTANTGLAAARQGSRVLLVDADSAGLRLTHIFSSFKSEDGETRALTEREVRHETNVDLAKSISTPGGDNIDLLTVEMFPDGASLRAPANRSFFSALREAYDLVLIDTPALLVASDAAALAPYADGAVLVIPHGAIMNEVEEAASRLELLGTPVVGYVYNDVPPSGRRNPADSAAGANRLSWRRAEDHSEGPDVAPRAHAPERFPI